MLNKVHYTTFYICVILISCSGANENTKLKFEVVSDTLFKPTDAYNNDLSEWKRYYENCTNERLFDDAFYFELHNQLGIGTINNQHALEINGKINILDTSNNRNIFNLLSTVNSSNCGDTFSLNNHLKKTFYDEVAKVLNKTAEYKNVPEFVDTGEMKIRIGTVANVALIPDSLINLLNTTKNTLLLRYKELLLRPGNALLAQTIEILGFNVEFPLQKKLSKLQIKQLTHGESINISSSDNANIKLLANNVVHIEISKRYTVLGKFLKFESDAE